MSDPEDIVDKADAFLGRYRPGAEVPLLTDVVDPAGATRPQGAPPKPAHEPLSDEQLRALEREITQRVLEAIQPALSALSEQYKTQADAIVREAVAKALERELRPPRPPGS
jgi:hypothetical protein